MLTQTQLDKLRGYQEGSIICIHDFRYTEDYLEAERAFREQGLTLAELPADQIKNSWDVDKRILVKLIDPAAELLEKMRKAAGVYTSGGESYLRGGNMHDALKCFQNASHLFYAADLMDNSKTCGG